MAAITPETQAALDAAFVAKDKADQATNDHNVAVGNLATAQSAESQTASAETAAHKAASEAALVALRDMAADLGVTLPASAQKQKK